MPDRRATCDLPVLDAEHRARICGAPAATIRIVEGIPFNACAACAAAHDARDDGHCHGPECFRDDDEPIDVCACECDRCVEAREQLLREQGEADEEEHGDPSGNGGAGPTH